MTATSLLRYLVASESKRLKFGFRGPSSYDDSQVATLTLDEVGGEAFHPEVPLLAVACP